MEIINMDTVTNGPICYMCNGCMNSYHHKTKCITIPINYCITQSLHEKIKPMVIPNLDNAYGIIIVEKDKYITVGHHNNFDQTILWIDQHLNTESEFKIIIKLPGEWKKNTDIFFQFGGINHDYLFNTYNKQNMTIILLPYQDNTKNGLQTLYKFKGISDINYPSNNLYCTYENNKIIFNNNNDIFDEIYF